MRRFFYDSSSQSGDQIVLDEQESHHITRVLRLAEGSEVELLDGRGSAYRARIIEAGKRVKLRICAQIVSDSAKNSRQLILGQAILKGQKMDELVQRCTELGVDHFMPFWSSRCQGKLDPGRQLEKTARYLRISEAACKQSSRLLPMRLSDAETFASCICSREFPVGMQRIIFWEEEQEADLYKLEISAGSPGVAMLIGPEGGFSQSEVETAKNQGWQPVSLGGRILRAETATLAAVAIIQYLLGNM